MRADTRNYLDTMPMFRYGVVFGVGILLSSVLTYREWLVALMVAVGLGVVAWRWVPRACGALVLCAVMCAGGVRMSHAERSEDVAAELLDGSVVDCRLAVLTEPVAYGKVMFMQALACEEGSPEWLRGRKMVVSLMRDTVCGRHLGVHTGSVLRAEARLSGVSQNMYDRWLRTGGVVARAFVASERWAFSRLCEGDMSWWQRVRLRAAAWRERLVGKMRAQGMEGDEFDIAVAMSLGYKTTLSKAVRKDFRYTGASHILAVSGTHIAVLFMLLRLVFRVRRRWLLPVVWAYVVVVGAPMSAVRAAMMVTLWELVLSLERSQHPLNVYGAAFMAMVVADPVSLYDVSFQLSYAAVLFILLLLGGLNSYTPKCIRHPIAYDFRRYHPLLSRSADVVWGAWGVMTVSLAAQLGTLPLTMHYFGTLPVLALFVSLLVVPAAAVIIPLTLLAAATVAFGVPYVSVWLWEALRCVVLVVHGGVSWVAGLPFSYVENVRFGWVRVTCAYIVLTAFAVLLNRHRLGGRAVRKPLPLPF